MPKDSYVQLSPDGTGKLVDMDEVASAAGATLYRQRAVLVGETHELLQQLLMVNLQQLAVLRAILAIKRADHPGSPGEEDYTQDLTPNDY